MFTSGFVVGKGRHGRYINPLRAILGLGRHHFKKECCRHRTPCTPGFCNDGESSIAAIVATALGDSASETCIW